MKRLTLYTTLLLTTAIGCSKSTELYTDSATYSEHAMTFAGQVDALTSRGTECTTANFASDFKVSVVLSPILSETVVPYLVPLTSSDGWCQFLDVTKSGNYWNYANGATYYWPSDDTKGLNIAAVYPNYNYTTNTQYGITISHTANDSVPFQADMLFSYEEDVCYDDTNNGVYNINFSHALAKIGFTAQIAEGYDGNDTAETNKKPKLSVTVKEIILHNMESRGNFYIKHATEKTEDYLFWAHTLIDGKNPVSNYYATLASNAIDVSHYEDNSATQLTSTTDVMMLVPFMIRPWVPANGLDKLDDATNGADSYIYGYYANRQDIGSFLAIDCTIKQTIQSSDGQEDTTTIYDGYIYVPFSSTGITYTDGTYADKWRWGHAITYNLIFGGGYTTNPEDGKTPVETLTEVSYNVTTEPWVEQQVDVDDDDKSISVTYTVQGITENPYEVNMEDGTVTTN